jgi:1,4-dihydroxy-2-naphthoyl-CoA hydrolase
VLHTRTSATSRGERMTAPSADSPATDMPDPAPWKIILGELDEKMGVKIVEESVQRVVATMPVEGNRQSFGLLHGGASLAVGEAVGSWAAVIHASTLGKTAVGVDVSATHHRSAREGRITITATPIHLGGTLTTHEVVITNDAGQRLCTLRITNLLMDRKV